MNNQNQALQKSQDQFMAVRDLLERAKNEIAKALPKSITPERITRIALTTLRKNSGLLACDPNSFLGAVMQASQLGLEIDDNLGLAYLVPFFNKKRGIKEVQLIIGYRGLIELARRSGKLKSISARIVYENEPFSIEYGLTENLTHTPLSPSERGTNIKGVYAVATTNDSIKVFEFLWLDELKEIKKKAREKSTNPSTSIWAKNEEEMMKKTVIRKMMKYLSLSPEVTKATVIDEYGEAGVNTKDMFIDIQAEKQTQLGLTEPKAIAQEKVTEMSAYRTQAETNINDNSKVPETKAKLIDNYSYQGEDAAYNECESNDESIPDWVDENYFLDIDLNTETTSNTENTDDNFVSGQSDQKKDEQKKQSESKKKTTSNDLITNKQVDYVYGLCHNKEIEITDLKDIIATVTGTDLELEEIGKKDAVALIDYIKNLV
ncbi:MAG: recombinase RecT [bacterium]